jgi:hypothetical protein
VSRIISLASNTTLDLGPGKTISVGGGRYSGNGALVPLAPVLTAGPEGVRITALPAGTAVLTAAIPLTTSASNSEEAAKRNANKMLTLGSGGIEITYGTLEVAPEATFTIRDVTVTTKIGSNSDTLIGFLSVADGGKINLLDAAAGGTSSIDIGDTEIGYPGGGNNTVAALVASGGAVSLGNNTIAGAKGAVLAVTSNDATIGVGEAVTGTKSLTVKGITLDLAGRGVLAIVSAPAFNRLILTDGAKLNLYNPPEGATAAAPDPAAGLSNIGTPALGGNGGISGDAVLQILSTNTSRTPRALSLAHDGVGSSVNVTGIIPPVGGGGPPSVSLNRSAVFSQ